MMLALHVGLYGGTNEVQFINSALMSSVVTSSGPYGFSPINDLLLVAVPQESKTAEHLTAQRHYY